MEVVGLIGSTISIFDALQKLRRYARDVINAPTEREQFLQRLTCIEVVDKAIKAVKSAAAPNAQWLHELDPIVESSPVCKLSRTMQEMMVILAIDPKDEGFKAKFKNMKWHSEKKLLDGLFEQVKGHCVLILMVLQWGSIEIQNVFAVGIQSLAGIAKETKVLIEEGEKKRDATGVVIAKTASDVAEGRIDDKENLDLTRQTVVRLDSLEAMAQAEREVAEKERERATRKKVEKWLSPLEFQQRQQIIFEKAAVFRKGGIGKWFFDCEEFVLWQDGFVKQLWGYGAPGSGKTVLSSVVVNQISGAYPQLPVLCIYLEKTEGHIQTPKNIRGSLLKQLIQFKETGISPAILTVFDKASRTDTLPNDRDTAFLLEGEMELYPRVFLVVDGLDEASHESRWLIQDSLLSISPKLSSLVMTRKDDQTNLEEICCDICDEVCIRYYTCQDCEKLNREVLMCFACKTKDEKCPHENGASHTLVVINPDRCEVTIKTPPDDIASFVYSSITDQFPPDLKVTDLGSRRRNLRWMVWKCFSDPLLLNKIVDFITVNADGRFLLAREYLKHFLNQNDMRIVKNTLNSEQNSANEKVFPFYAEDMKSIMEPGTNDSLLAKKVFSTVFFAKRNLTLKELLQAIDTQPGDNEYIDGERDDTIILNVTKGLIAIERNFSEDGDPGGMTVRFDHLTRREFFEHNDTWKSWFPEGLHAMASNCLTFLFFDTFAKPCRPEEDFLKKENELPFVSYAVQFWGDHVRDAGPDANDIKEAAIRYLQDPDRVEAYIQAAWIANTRHREKWDVRRDVHPLHICAWFDLSFLMPFLRRDPKDINVQEETHGQTPLMYACRRGNVETVRWLLTLGALVNKQSEKGRTALFEALLRLKKDPKNNDKRDVAKSKQIVDLLLDPELRGNKIDVNLPNPRHLQRTALMTSIKWQQLDIARAILKNPNLKINKQDLDGVSALHIAACKGFPDIVERILQIPSVEVDLNDTGRRSPMNLGAQFGDDPQVIKKLLEHGANPNQTDNRGGTVIMRATEAGNHQAFEVLVNSTKNIKPELTCVDEDGRSLWHHAAACGNVKLIELLKIWIPSRFDSSDAVEMTPLHDACKYGNLDAARKLVEYGAKSTVKDKLGRTPSTIVRQYGQENLMTLFNEDEIKPAVDVPKPNLPLWSLAALRRLDDITNGISTNAFSFDDTEPRTKRTALHTVLLDEVSVTGKEDNQIEILKQLLATRKFSIDDIDAQNHTPLHLAAMYGNMEATKLLLAHDPNLEIENRFGMTPLRIACLNKHPSIAIALIEAGAFIDRTKLDLDELLFAALAAQKVKVVKELMTAGANRMAQDEEGRTPDMVARKDPMLVGYLSSTKSYMWKATTMNPKEEIDLDMMEETIGDAVEMLNDVRGEDTATRPQVTFNGRAAKDIRFKPFTSSFVDLVDRKAADVTVTDVPSPGITVRSLEQVEGLLKEISGTDALALDPRAKPSQEAVFCN